MSPQERMAKLQAAQDFQDAKALRDTASVSGSYVSGETGSEMPKDEEQEFTTHQIMLAIQHMSGRVLSDVQEVGIEIKSEPHEICEKVAQMQMAVEELSWRAELVRREQETLL